MAHKDPRTVFTETMIKKSCIEMMIKKPITKITINELCERVGINRTTFYKYYTDIYDLYEKIEEDYYVKLTEELGEFNFSDINSYYSRLLTMIKDNYTLSIILVKNMETSKLVSKSMEYYKKHIINLWNKEHPKLTDMEIEYLFAALVGGSTAIIGKWLQDGMEESIDNVCSFMNRLCFLGVLV